MAGLIPDLDDYTNTTPSGGAGSGGTSTAGQGTGYGTSDWEPDSNTLTTLTADQIAEGYGLDPNEYADYFQSFDGWKGNFAQEQFDIDSDSLGAKKDYEVASLQGQADTLQLESQQAGQTLSDTLSSNIMQSSDAYADTMAQMVDAQASSLMGGASTRAARTMGARAKEKTDLAGSGANVNYGATTARIDQALNDITRQTDYITDQYTRDEASLALDRDYTIRGEVEQFKNEIYDTLGILGTEGAFDGEDKTTSDWIDEITSGTKWSKGDFNSDDYDDDFLQWFAQNESSIDKSLFDDSGEEVRRAYNDYKRGAEAGSSTKTWCCTAAEGTGHLSKYQTARLGMWHKQQSQIWQDGYHVWGKIIADYLVWRFDWAGRWTKAFYRAKVLKKPTKQSTGAILFIAPMSYLIGSLISVYKRIMR